LDSYKITVPGNATPDIYVFKLRSEEKKRLIFSQRMKLKNYKHKLFLNEDLTKSDSSLFKKARADVKSGKLFSTWTKNGLVWGKLSDSGKPFLISEGKS
jgi:hypothetical protein